MRRKADTTLAMKTLPGSSGPAGAACRRSRVGGGVCGESESSLGTTGATSAYVTLRQAKGETVYISSDKLAATYLKTMRRQVEETRGEAGR